MMQGRADEYDRRILSIVSNDFEPLESIVAALWSGDSIRTREADHGHLHCRLLRLIEHHLIHAYLLHAEPPYLTRVEEVGYDALPTAWFLITENGRSYLGEPGPDAPKPGSALEDSKQAHPSPSGRRPRQRRSVLDKRNSTEFLLLYDPNPKTRTG